MCQNLRFPMLLLVFVLTTGGGTTTTEKVPGPPQDGAAVLDLNNGLADCGEDINPSLCNSSAITEECAKNSSVKQSCQFSCSPSGQLWRAAWRGNLDAVNAAIAGGANPLCQKTNNVLNYFYDGLINMTAIHLAAMANHAVVVMALLDAGVYVDLQTTEGKTPTYYASVNGSIDALNILIGQNANVKLPTINGWTPLMVTSLYGHLSVAKALINANASLDVTGGNSGATAIYYAALRNNEDIVLLLIEHNANVNIAAHDGQTPLIAAARHDRLSLAKVLTNANASLDVIGGWQNATAIYYAVWGNYEDIVLLLIEHNANVNIADHDGETPLMAAARHGKLSLAKALINANANVNIAAYDGKTPLMAAAHYGDLSVAKALINANASLDLIDREFGNTALHWAARSGKKDTAILLIKSGAYTRMPNKDGNNPADEARLGGHNQLAELIESYTNQCRSGVLRHKWC